MADRALTALLWGLGLLMTLSSRFHPSLRSQITRSMTFQVSAGSRVSHVWEFDSPTRRIRAYRGRLDAPDGSLHFRTSWKGLVALTSSTTVNRVVAGLRDGSVEIGGSAFVVMWFHGLSRKFYRRGRNAGPRYELPHRYLAVDPATWGAEKIIIEPAVERLDPRWTSAYRARATLLQVRSTTGEPVLEP